MGRAVARVRGNRRCLKHAACRGDCSGRCNVSLGSGLETNTCYWYQSRSWAQMKKRL